MSSNASHRLVPSPFVTRPQLNEDSSPAQTGRENGPTSLEGPVLHLSTAKPAEGPDEHQILTSQLTTPTAADYLPSAPPLSLSVNQFQECHFSGESLPTTIHFNTLSSGERTRDRGVPPCDQSKGTKQISSEGEVQNGGAPYCSLSSTQGRLII